MPTRCNRWFLLQILLLAQHISGTAMPIIRDSRVLYKRLLPVVFGALVFKLSAPHHTDNLKTKAPNTTGSNHLYDTLELLMMGIVVPEICWASNKICNKNHLLHLVGILFPHIRTKIISACEQNGSTIKRFWKPERSDVDEALLKLFKQERGDKVPASGPLLMKTLVLPRF